VGDLENGTGSGRKGSARSGTDGHRAAAAEDGS